MIGWLNFPPNDSCRSKGGHTISAMAMVQLNSSPNDICSRRTGKASLLERVLVSNVSRVGKIGGTRLEAWRFESRVRICRPKPGSARDRMPAGESLPARTNIVRTPRQILQSSSEASCISSVDVYHLSSLPSDTCFRAAENASSWITMMG